MQPNTISEEESFKLDKQLTFLSYQYFLIFRQGPRREGATELSRRFQPWVPAIFDRHPNNRLLCENTTNQPGAPAPKTEDEYEYDKSGTPLTSSSRTIPVGRGA